MEELKQEELEKAAAKKTYVDGKVPPLHLDALNLGLHHINCVSFVS